MDQARWERLEQLFHEVLGLDPDARRAHLEAATDDEALRREVLELVERDEGPTTGEEGASQEASLPTPRSSLGELLEGAASQALALEGPGVWEGREIGPYRVLREIGRGGMGVVLLAERSDGAYERRVAIKLSLAGFASPALAAQLERERRILATLDHPSIARLVDGGTTEEGLPYVVMDYVEGLPIDRFCETRKLGVRERLSLFLKVTEAVEHAHRGLVVHRDLKPTNVLVTEEGTPRLLDFGIAKLLAADAEGSNEHQTKTMLRALTPEYAAPEQVRGEPVTTASDVYALGVVLFELLTGTRPFRLEGESAGEAERVLLTKDPPRPSRAARGGRARSLEGDLDNIVLKALRKEPDRRYQSVREMADDVRRHLEGRPVSARPNTLAYRAGRFVGRHRVGVALAALIVLAAALGLTYHTRQLAEERDRALVAAEKSARIADYLEGLFRAANPNESAGETLTAIDLLERGAANIEADLASEPLVQQELLIVMADAFRELGEFERALALGERALALAEPAGAGDAAGGAGVRRALALQSMAAAHAALGDEERARALSAEVRDRLESAPAQDAAAATALYNLALLSLRAGQHEEALELAREAHDRRVALYGAQHSSSASSLAVMASVHRASGDNERAYQLLEESLAIRLEMLGERHSDTAETLIELAAIDEERGELALAVERMEQALAIRRALLRPEHPALGYACVNISTTLVQVGELERAEELAREGLNILESALPAGARNVLLARATLASVLSARGRFDEALALQERSVAELVEKFGAEHPSSIIQAHNLAAQRHDAGQFERAREDFAALLPLFTELFGEEHPNVGFTHAALAKSLLELRRLEETITHAERARAIIAKSLGERAPALGLHLSLLGRARLGQGRLEKARVLLDEALALRREVYEASENLAVADSLHELGELELAVARPAEAKARFEEALAIRRAVHGKAHGEIALSLAGLAAAHFEAGAIEEARRVANEALEVAREASAPPHVLGRTLALRGRFLFEAGDDARAKESLEEAERALSRSYAEDHPLRIEVAGLLASIDSGRGT